MSRGRSFSLSSTIAWGHADRLLRARAQHLDVDGRAVGNIRECVAQIGWPSERLVADPDEQITELYACKVRRFTLGKRDDDERNLMWDLISLRCCGSHGDGMYAHADERPAHVTACEQLVDDGIHDGCRQRDCGTARECGIVDADDRARRRDEWTTGEAVVHRKIETQ